MGWDKDLPPGEGLVACFRPFIEHLVASESFPEDHSQARRQPVDAGRRDHPRPERKPFSEKDWRSSGCCVIVIHDDGGPLIHNGSEEEQRSFDSTCRKLHRFLTQPSAEPASYPQILPDEAIVFAAREYPIVPECELLRAATA